MKVLYVYIMFPAFDFNFKWIPGSRVGDGKSECVNAGRFGQCVPISEDSVGFSG